MFLLVMIGTLKSSIFCSNLKFLLRRFSQFIYVFFIGLVCDVTYCRDELL